MSPQCQILFCQIKRCRQTIDNVSSCSPSPPPPPPPPPHSNIYTTHFGNFSMILRNPNGKCHFSGNMLIYSRFHREKKRYNSFLSSHPHPLLLLSHPSPIPPPVPSVKLECETRMQVYPKPQVCVYFLSICLYYFSLMENYPACTSRRINIESTLIQRLDVESRSIQDDSTKTTLCHAETLPLIL